MEPAQRMVREIEREVQMTARMTGRRQLDPRVMQAMAEVPRHEFVPEDLRELAYVNEPLSIGYGQTISQPYIVALMTDLLEPKPEHTVLEIGTGSGYQAAVLSRLVKTVYTQEIVPELAAQAEQRFKRLGYDNVFARVADGYEGWVEHAPFDGIIVTAAARSIPQALEDQLAPGGHLVLPIGMPYAHQELVTVTKDVHGKRHVRDVLGVAFVPLVHDTSANEASS